MVRGLQYQSGKILKKQYLFMSLIGTLLITLLCATLLSWSDKNTLHMFLYTDKVIK